MQVVFVDSEVAYMNWIKEKAQGGRDCWRAEAGMGYHQAERDLQAVAGVAGIGKVAAVVWTHWFDQT